LRLRAADDEFDRGTSDSVIDMVIWASWRLMCQIAAYTWRAPDPDLSQRIAAGEMARHLARRRLGDGRAPHAASMAT